MNFSRFSHCVNALSSVIIAVVIAAAPLSLKADDGPKHRFGLQVSYADPSGGLSDMTSSGFGLSLFGERALTKNNAIRAKIEYLDFGDREVIAWDWDVAFGLDCDVNILGVSADWLYRFDSHDTGPFFFVGAGLLDITRKLSSDYNTESESKTKVSYSVGFGFNFTKNLGLEIKFTKAPGLKFEGVYDKFDADWIQASFSYRFYSNFINGSPYPVISIPIINTLLLDYENQNCYKCLSS